MAKEVLIYGLINSYSSSEFFRNVNDALAADPSEEIVFRINTEGGEPEYGWGQIAKIQEIPNKKIKVDGAAHSMGLFMLCYCEDSTALDVSQFLLHRAAYPAWFEQDPTLFTQVLRDNLANVNASLEKAFRNKVDVAKFEAMKGVKVKDIFSMDSRLEVVLTAAEAKKIGLIKTYYKITPEKQAKISAYISSVQSKFGGIRIAADSTHITNQELKTTMTLEELKSKYPEVYLQAVNEGITKERDRVEACLVYNDIDPAGVKASIESGRPLSAKQMAEFALKSLSANGLKDLASGNAAEVKTSEDDSDASTDKEKELETFRKEARSHLKIS